MKDKWMAVPRWLRTTLIALLAAAVLGLGIYGILVLIRTQGGGVNVYPVMDLSVEYASAGNAETEGRVTTDKIQSVYVSETQQVTRIHVKEGQRVSVGDELLSFDTTLTDLELERQDITVRRLELELEDAKRRQAEINTYRVYVSSAPSAPSPDSSQLHPGDLGKVHKGSGVKDDPFVFLWDDTCSFTDEIIRQIVPAPGGVEPSVVYAVFEVRQGNSLQGSVLRCWEMVFRRSTEGWSFTLVEPEYDQNLSTQPESGSVELNLGQSYDYATLVQMKQEAAQRILDLELELKMARLRYETLEYELTSGVVLSQIDGVVKSVLTPEEALMENKPVVLVSGGGGYYVTGAMSETELSSMHVGDSVTVRSWETYENLTGTITEISPYPVESGRYWHYSSGNQNVSLYPFTVFLSEDVSLRENEYVQISYDPSGAGGGGLCLQTAFIRSENGKSYIYVQGEDGRLEQRFVRTGRSLWGSYLEILEGLSRDDCVAFPYGRAVRPGARTKVAGIDELYNYY